MQECASFSRYQAWSDAIQRQLPIGCEDVKHVRKYVALETISTISDLVVNGPLALPALTVQSRIVGGVERLKVHEVDV